MIAVTGGSGWVGQAVLRRIAEERMPGFSDRRTSGERGLELESWGSSDEFVRDAVAAGAKVLVHCAGNAHQRDVPARGAAEAFARVNTEGTRGLAEAAVRHGVRRFIFVSTIKVNGETTSGRAFSGRDEPHPMDPYACSKWRAEQALKEISERGDLDVVIVRPPLMYGAGVKANFRSLVGFVMKGMPLPFASITENRRSIAGVRNFSDAVFRLAFAPEKAVRGKTFAFADHPAVSTAVLIRKIALSAGLEPKMWRIPTGCLRFAAGLSGRGMEMRRLTESLEVDGSDLVNALDWRPAISMDMELEATVQGIRMESR